MQIFVKTLTGKTITLYVEASVSRDAFISLTDCLLDVGSSSRLTMQSQQQTLFKEQNVFARVQARMKGAPMPFAAAPAVQNQTGKGWTLYHDTPVPLNGGAFVSVVAPTVGAVAICIAIGKCLPK
eukprot:TRINITY_DN13201_c0_g1_i1.p2 TRINITY_DN13201_c0_g1~~TRINITY_DN13201_c0_g1_i1.p2  ORF type:complete len:125 (-),score=27.11 TRINITY_DN13201_c0_g1_i1:75-449(-)